ncbi:hypothetical protein FQN50_004658 [Emmonsiellopsis sp. PD_5]|nr:hypothetical protein FQN50_004658 [Emmonsiellopsis sp. PD_5]
MDHTRYDEPPSDNHELQGKAEERACTSCRKRKLKCSRELPSCTHCLRLETSCVYDHKKNKPGIKTGAVESLSRRVEALENALLHHGESNAAGSFRRHSPNQSACIHDVLSVLARELKKVNESGNSGFNSPGRSHSRRCSIANDTPCSANDRPPQKRRRVDRDDASEELDVDSDEYNLPSSNVVSAVVETYFAIIHPWIPMLHQARFQHRLSDPHQKPKLAVILHAMMVVALPHVRPDIRAMIPGGTDAGVRKSRSTVILTAMDSLSVENLQALIIIAFDNMGKGQGAKAFSIIGSLSRTVEYLQLTVEADEHERQPLLKPLSSLSQTRNWTEAEERRRVFWVIFLLDRFCSVTTGWNTSLTSDDVRRRLPSDGGLWAQEEPVTTPYFGIWDKSAAKIGNSIAYIPAHYPSPDHLLDNAPDTRHRPSNIPSSGGPGAEGVDISTIGAFAYCIEATESLSQVTTFFLQQRVNFQDRQEVGSWLTRFKELDLRLVHWKMFLPQKWKDSNISREPALINMDPNLTLAHITHNTSMILLHQRIAYPPPDWSEIVKLPSFCSAETCQLAAVETSDISKKYLKYTPPEGIVPSQFTFCVFVSARVLLVHWRFYDAKLLPAFWILVDCLQEMSARWHGALSQQDIPSQRTDQAMKYCQQLRDLYKKCTDDPGFRLDVLGYSSEIGLSDSSSTDTVKDDRMNREPAQSQNDTQTYPHNSRPEAAPISPGSQSSPSLSSLPATGSASITAHPPTLPLGNGTHHPNKLNSGISTLQHKTSSISPPQARDLAYPRLSTTTQFPPRYQHQPPDLPTNKEDELSLISHVLLGQQFLEMDRVISFDDTTFVLDDMSVTINGAAGAGAGTGTVEGGGWGVRGGVEVEGGMGGGGDSAGGGGYRGAYQGG